MINIEQLKCYERVVNLPEKHPERRSKANANLLADNSSLIYELIDHLFLIQNVKVSKEFENRALKKAKEVCDKEETYQYLLTLPKLIFG